MFDSLKKKLKEAVEKVSRGIKEERPQEKEKKVVEVTEVREQGEWKEVERRQEFEEEKVEPLPEPEREEEVEKKEKILEKEIFDKYPIEEEEKKIQLDTEDKTPGIDREEIREADEERDRLKEERIQHAELVDVDELLKELPSRKIEPKKHEIVEVDDILEEKKEKRGLLSRIFEKTITDDDAAGVIRELELVLLESDVAVEVAEKIGNDVRRAIVNKNVRRGHMKEIIKDALRAAMLEVMKQERIDIEKRINDKAGVFTVMFLGFNGTGKTTTLAKFSYKFKKFRPVVAAGDTFRAASIEQLEEHSRRVGFRVVKHNYGADAAAVIYDAKKAALASGSKLVLADTAGRSHSNVNLMDELKKVVHVNNPDLKILVLDSLTGNDIYEQSRLFNDAVGIDAIILTKADVYDKGGAALSAAYTTKKPIIYLGVGQSYDDLKEFDPKEIVEQLLG